MQAGIDANRTKTLLGVSSLDLKTPIPFYVNPATNALLIDGASILPPLDARYLQRSLNLSDLASVPTARTNLGLGTIALLNSIDISANTNLAATTPITLTGDTVGLDISALQTTLDSRYVNILGDIMTGELIAEQSGFQTPTLSTRITGDTQKRVTLDNWGIIKWSGGSGSFDTNLYRYLPNTLKTDGNINVGGGTVSFEANGTSVQFAGNQYFNAGALKHSLSIYTPNNDFFLDSSLTAGGAVTIFSANGDDKRFRLFRTDTAGRVGIHTGFGGEDADLHVVGTTHITGDIELDSALNHDGTTAGFYGTTPITKQTGVAVTAAGVHAALVNLGLIT